MKILIFIRHLVVVFALLIFLINICRIAYFMGYDNPSMQRCCDYTYFATCIKHRIYVSPIRAIEKLLEEGFLVSKDGKS